MILLHFLTCALLLIGETFKSLFSTGHFQILKSQIVPSQAVRPSVSNKKKSKKTESSFHIQDSSQKRTCSEAKSLESRMDKSEPADGEPSEKNIKLELQEEIDVKELSDQISNRQGADAAQAADDPSVKKLVAGSILQNPIILKTILMQLKHKELIKLGSTCRSIQNAILQLRNTLYAESEMDLVEEKYLEFCNRALPTNVICDAVFFRDSTPNAGLLHRLKPNTIKFHCRDTTLEVPESIEHSIVDVEVFLQEGTFSRNLTQTLLLLKPTNSYHHLFISFSFQGSDVEFLDYIMTIFKHVCDNNIKISVKIFRELNLNLDQNTLAAFAAENAIYFYKDDLQFLFLVYRVDDGFIICSLRIGGFVDIFHVDSVKSLTSLGNAESKNIRNKIVSFEHPSYIFWEKAFGIPKAKLARLQKAILANFTGLP